MYHQAIAGFLSALCVMHATVAVYSLFLYTRPGHRPGLRAEEPRSAPGPGSAAGGKAPPSVAGRRPDRELLAFGLLNLSIVVLDGGLARAHALAAAPMDAASIPRALLAADVGRVAALVLLLHFVLQYARMPRPAPAVAGLYAAGAALEIAAALGALRRYGEPRTADALILGARVPDVHAIVTPLGAVFAVLSVGGVLFALWVLGRAFVRGRREALGFVGLTLLAVAAATDALRSLDLVVGPPFAPFGYAAFINGVMMTLLARFTALRSQLEQRAGSLKDRARELSRSYAELRAAQDDLVRKEQLAAVGELSAVVAHEVRNPLAIISNAVATLRRAGVGEEDKATLLQILDEETSRLNHLVGDLLRYARPITLERQLVSLRDLCERGLAVVAKKDDLVVELVEPHPVDRVWADPNLVRQVIENLVTNAVQAMSGDGTLTVTLANESQGGARGVEIQIQDTGEGMDTQVRARALDPFFTTRPSGTGLGLAIVARIVDTHGGTLRIRSKAGVGTVMHVFLPRSSEGAPPRSPGDRSERTSSDPPLPAELKKAMGERPP